MLVICDLFWCCLEYCSKLGISGLDFFGGSSPSYVKLLKSSVILCCANPMALLTAITFYIASVSSAAAAKFIIGHSKLWLNINNIRRTIKLTKYELIKHTNPCFNGLKHDGRSTARGHCQGNASLRVGYLEWMKQQLHTIFVNSRE